MGRFPQQPWCCSLLWGKLHNLIQWRFPECVWTQVLACFRILRFYETCLTWFFLRISRSRKPHVSLAVWQLKGSRKEKGVVGCGCRLVGLLVSWIIFLSPVDSHPVISSSAKGHILWHDKVVCRLTAKVAFLLLADDLCHQTTSMQYHKSTFV